MKKRIIISIVSSFSSLVYCQVGIHTPNPHPSSDLELGSTNKTLYLNRVANPEADIANPQPGMILFDTTKKCLRAYQGDPASWSDCLGSESSNGGSVSALMCSSAVFSPAMATQGQNYTGTLTIPYTGGNGGAYVAQTFTQNGLTFTLAAGNFTNSTGNIVYNIIGFPTAVGITSVNVTIGRQTCAGLSLAVNQSGGGVLPPNIILGQNRRHWIASVYDQNYLPYTVPTVPASTAVVNADSTNEPVTVDYLGTITTTGISVQIPVASVTGTGIGNIQAWTNTIIIPASLTNNNTAAQLQLSWAAQSFTASAKFITATIKAVGNTLEAKKLDINAGIGNDYLGLLLGAFQYPYNSTGIFTNYEVRDIPGIPDRMFGLADKSGNTTSHLMLYLPVQDNNGKVWLNNNLGANYSNLNNANFNLARQATAENDVNAYGSLYQWGRASDGHEFRNSATTSTQSNNDIPAHANFIIGYDNWRNPTNYNLWQGVNGVNNPCPVGFRIPNRTEWDSQITTWSPGNSSGAFNSPLKLTTTGARISWDNGSIILVDSISNTPMGEYCTSQSFAGSTAAYLVAIYSDYIGTGTNRMAIGRTVRCIQN